MEVKVLDTIYEITEKTVADDVMLETADGYCDTSVKKIVIGKEKRKDDSLENLDVYRQQVLRHELVHAFLHECGLDGNSWASNEEIVDWIAISFPKLLKAFKEVGAV